MMIPCGSCGSDIELNQDDCENTISYCKVCGWKIPTYIETYFNGSGIECGLPKLHIGTVIKVTNAEHVWREDIGIIVDRKFKFYRIELNGVRTWVPEHWVEAHEHS